MAGNDYSFSENLFSVRIQFINTSTDATTFHWDFGNGNFSTLKTPSNVYYKTGSYSVKLVAIGEDGKKEGRRCRGFK